MSIFCTYYLKFLTFHLESLTPCHASCLFYDIPRILTVWSANFDIVSHLQLSDVTFRRFISEVASLWHLTVKNATFYLEISTFYYEIQTWCFFSYFWRFTSKVWQLLSQIKMLPNYESKTGSWWLFSFFIVCGVAGPTSLVLQIVFMENSRLLFLLNRFLPVKHTSSPSTANLMQLLGNYGVTIY